MEKSDAPEPSSKESNRRGYRSLKKINTRISELKRVFNNQSGKVRIMFQDEAGFGRINKPKYCWCTKGIRPSVPCHHIREYRYAYGAVDPVDGDNFFLVMPSCDSICMNVFLSELSKSYPNDMILLCCDGARWHKSSTLEVPKNIELFFIPPYTPEMNPIEQIWKELRKMGFRNEVFQTLDKVVERLCETIRKLTKTQVQSVTGRKWIIECF